MPQLIRSVTLWFLTQSKLDAQNELPPLGELMSVVVLAVLCGMVFMAGLFVILATAGELPWAPRARPPIAALNGVSVLVWAALALRFDSMFWIFAVGQLAVLLVLSARKKQARPAGPSSWLATYEVISIIASQILFFVRRDTTQRGMSETSAPVM